MLDVYCISGMGVDERLFKNLKLNNCTIHHLKWITPLNNESLEDYAMRLSLNIDTSKPYALAGVSFGGMCAVEIAKRLNPVATFLISSCKKSSELPLLITFWKRFTLYKLMNDKLFIKGAMALRWRFGIKTREQSQQFYAMLNSNPPDYFSGAVHCILNWKNDIVPPRVIHIHGTADKVLPFRKVTADYIIEGGTHLMIVTKAREINEIINNELLKIR
jgi:hypothetical protein